jgi:hypothetical protein
MPTAVASIVMTYKNGCEWDEKVHSEILVVIKHPLYPLQHFYKAISKP